MLDDLFYHFKKYGDIIAGLDGYHYVRLEFFSGGSGDLVGYVVDSELEKMSASYSYTIFHFDSIKDAMEKMHKEVARVRELVKDGKTNITKDGV